MRNASPEAYDPFVLSDEEEKRFVAALGDGFGYSHRHQAKGLDQAAMPAEIEAGLLKHRIHYDWRRLPDTWQDDQNGGFWKESDGDSGPGLFEICPVNFYFPAIRKYFLEQKAAYFRYAKSADDYEYEQELNPDEKDGFDEWVYRQVLYKTYSKAWYEYHINLFIFFIDETVAMFTKQIESSLKVGYGFAPIISFSAKLGRLLEQYYWKFLVEKSAIRGDKISIAATSGGHSKASKQRRIHAGWQDAARAIWQENPTASKMTVAVKVKKRLKLAPSVKHISRVIIRL